MDVATTDGVVETIGATNDTKDGEAIIIASPGSVEPSTARSSFSMTAATSGTA
jgi:hypothetical protein